MNTVKIKVIPNYILIFALIAYMGYLVSCTHENQVIEPAEVINSETDLVAVKVATSPGIDGTIDATWDNSPKLEFEGAVPDPGGDLFRGLVGNVYNGTLRAAYDNENIYLLAEWKDPSQSLLRQPWYFDPATKKWALESGAPTFSASGAITRDAFGEDKVGFLWNINKSVSGWNNGTCYKSCHSGMAATDGFARHKTNSPGEKIDMWHWKSARLNVVNQIDDQYQDFTYPNGRKNDAASSGGDKANTQTLNQPGIGNVSVPKYLIPGRTGYYWILQSEIENNTAKEVKAVDANGVLTLNDGTTVDPNTDVAFQRSGTTVGNKAIPGISTSAFIGSRGDIACKGVYTGQGWVLEIKRALKTADNVNDIDFSSLEDQYFGIGIFNNTSAAHAIKPNLVLKFKK